MRKVFILLCLAFVLVSCDIDKMTDQELLIGTWEDTWEDDDGDLSKERYVFTENEYTYSYEGYIHIVGAGKKAHSINQNGTYIYDGSTLTLYIEHTEDSENRDFPVSETPTSVPCTVSHNELKITHPNPRFGVLTYKRIS